MREELRNQPAEHHMPGHNGLGIVDLNRYSVDKPRHPDLSSIISGARAGLQRDGCARLSGFIHPSHHEALARETRDLAKHALFSTEQYTPYGQPPDESFPADHPRRRVHRTSSGNVTCDLIPADSPFQQLYRNNYFKQFIAACLETEIIYEFADPMRALTINAMPHGTYLGWHFDANDFIVSLMTRRADAGGTFNYCPAIRAPGNENYEAVQSVLDGDREHVKNLDLEVGDLQIFKGRYAMHQVTPVTGERQTVLFGYAHEPGFIGSAASTLRVYGRVMQAHIDADDARHTDGLED